MSLQETRECDFARRCLLRKEVEEEREGEEERVERDNGPQWKYYTWNRIRNTSVHTHK